MSVNCSQEGLSLQNRWLISTGHGGGGKTIGSGSEGSWQQEGTILKEVLGQGRLK